MSAPSQEAARGAPVPMPTEDMGIFVAGNPALTRHWSSIKRELKGVRRTMGDMKGGGRGGETGPTHVTALSSSSLSSDETSDEGDDPHGDGGDPRRTYQPHLPPMDWGDDVIRRLAAHHTTTTDDGPGAASPLTTTGASDDDERGAAAMRQLPQHRGRDGGAVRRGRKAFSTKPVDLPNPFWSRRYVRIAVLACLILLLNVGRLYGLLFPSTGPTTVPDAGLRPARITELPQ